MNSLVLTILRNGSISLVGRGIHTTTIAQNSVFMKKQKKIDPEVAKQREARRRKRLEKEIRQMQKHSKKPKPIDEMTIDVKSSKNISERYRGKIDVSVETMDERAVLDKEYSKSRNNLQHIDDAWVRLAIQKQTKALNELKLIDPELYAMAIQPTTGPIVLQGPAFTPPVKDYQSPDGDYENTTRTWT